MAKKQATKARGAAKANSDAEGVDEAPARRGAKRGARPEAAAKPAKGANKSAKPRKAARSSARAGAPAREASTASEARKVLSSAKKQARRLVPDVPTPSLPDIEIPAGVKALGSQVMSALNSDVGRVLVAELLVFVAGSLTKAAVKTEAAQDAAETVKHAGAKIGAAVASAGAQMVKTGSAAARSGAGAARDAAEGTGGIAREVAQVAVGAVGEVVADAATKFLKRGRKAGGQPESTNAGSPPVPASQPGTVPGGRPPRI